MKPDFFEFLIEERQRQEKYFQNYLFFAKEIKKEAEKLLGKTRVFVFGSILRSDEVPRDIDLLIISPRLRGQERGKIVARVWQKLGFDHPFEIHLVTPADYQDWYRHFLKERLEVK